MTLESEGVAAMTVTDERIRGLLQVTRPSHDWWCELTARLDDLALRMHEPMDVVEDAPRLIPQAEQLAREEQDLAEQLRATRSLVSHCAGDPRRAALAITAVADLLDRVQRHRRRSSRMLYEAYQVDLGGE